MALALGTKFGPYELSGAIGAGGMGEVYRARDLRQAIAAPSSSTGKTVLEGEIVCLDKFGRPQFPRLALSSRPTLFLRIRFADV